MPQKTEEPNTELSRLEAELAAYEESTGWKPTRTIRAATRDGRLYASMKRREAWLKEKADIIRKFMADNPPPQKNSKGGVRDANHNPERNPQPRALR